MSSLTSGVFWHDKPRVFWKIKFSQKQSILSIRVLSELVLYAVLCFFLLLDLFKLKSEDIVFIKCFVCKTWDTNRPIIENSTKIYHTHTRYASFLLQKSAGMAGLVFLGQKL